MRQKLSFLLAAVMLSQTALAQQPPVGSVTPVVGAGRGDTFIGSPGNYNFNQISQDNTRIALEVLKQIKNIQEVDRQYLLSVVNRLNKQLGELVNLQTAFYKLSLESQIGQPPTAGTPAAATLEKYLELVTKIRSKNSALLVDIETSSTISRESLPSYSPIDVAGTYASVANFGNINFTKVTERVNALRNQVVEEANAFSFPFLWRGTQSISITQNALNPQLRGIVTLTPQQIQEYENQILENYTVSAETAKYHQYYTELLVTNVLNFVKNYGTSEWLRFSNDNDGRARKEAFLAITDAFYRRSYLRQKYGIRMGAIQSKGFPKKIINLEYFGLQPMREALNSLRRDPAETDVDLQTAFENARNFVELWDAKVTPVFGKSKDIRNNPSKKAEEYSSKDTGLLVRANSALTYLTGQRRTSEVLSMIFRLVLADIREELMLSRSDLDVLVSYHDARYRSTPEVRTQSIKKICLMDWTLDQTTHNKVCVPLGVKKKALRATANTGRSVAVIFSNLLGQYRNVELNKRREAERLQTLIDAATAAPTTDVQEEIDDLTR